jgi:hypothetical protein
MLMTSEQINYTAIAYDVLSKQDYKTGVQAGNIHGVGILD